MVPLPTDFEELRRLALEQNWIVKKTDGGHWKFIPPKGKGIVIASHSPGSDSHIQPLRAELRKAGLLGVTPERDKPEQPKDTTEYFTMPPAEAKPVNTRAKYGQTREVILEAIKKQNGLWVYPEDISARVQAAVPKMDLQKLKIAMNGYAQSGTLVKREDGKYAFPAGPTGPLPGVPLNAPARVVSAPPPSPASEEDLKVLYGALEALAAAEQVIKKHIAIEGQLGQMKALLGGLTHGNAETKG